jgi:hypothetical protein
MAKKPVSKKEVKPKKSTKKQDEGTNALASMIGALAKAMKETEHYQYEENIKYPIKVKELRFQGRMGCTTRTPKDQEMVGGYVMIRPVGDEYKGKTFLGIYIGDIPLSGVRAYDPKKQILMLTLSSNPAIFVPDLNKVIMGAESWWGPIKDETQLRQITDEDIQNIWYVKALKYLNEREAKKAAEK